MAQGFGGWLADVHGSIQRGEIRTNRPARSTYYYSTCIRPSRWHTGPDRSIPINQLGGMVRRTQLGKIVRNGMDPGVQATQGGGVKRAVDQMSERLSNLDMRLPNCLVRTGVLALFHRPPIHAESLQNLRVFRTKNLLQHTTQMCAFGKESKPANFAKADDPQTNPPAPPLKRTRVRPQFLWRQESLGERIGKLEGRERPTYGTRLRQRHTTESALVGVTAR